MGAGQAQGKNTGARAEQPTRESRQELKAAIPRAEIIVGGAKVESPVGTPVRKPMLESRDRDGSDVGGDPGRAEVLTRPGDTEGPGDQGGAVGTSSH